MRVQGYLYDDTGTNLVETLADIRVDQSSMVAPKVTSAAEMALNLDSSDPNTTFDYKQSRWDFELFHGPDDL